MAFDLGDTVPLTFTVTDPSGAPVAAASAALTVTLPDGSSVAPAVSAVGTGVYRVDFVTSVAGRHLVRWVSTTPAQAYVDQFDVRSGSPGYIVSLADAKRHLKSLTTAVDEDELRGIVEATGEVVEILAGRVVVRRTVVEWRTVFGREFALSSPPVVSLTSIVDVDGVRSWVASAYQVDAASGVVYAPLGVPPVSGRVQATYVAGMPVVPARYSRAALVIIKHLWDTQRASSSSRSGRSGTGGAEVMVAGWSVPRAAVEMLTSPLPGFA